MEVELQDLVVEEEEGDQMTVEEADLMGAVEVVGADLTVVVEEDPTVEVVVEDLMEEVEDLMEVTEEVASEETGEGSTETQETSLEV